VWSVHQIHLDWGQARFDLRLPSRSSGSKAITTIQAIGETAVGKKVHRRARTEVVQCGLARKIAAKSWLRPLC